MLMMIAKFDLAVHLRQYNRYADEKLTTDRVYGLWFCQPGLQKKIQDACALIDFRSHQKDRWSFDHISVLLDTVLPWLESTLDQAQQDLTREKKRKKLPQSILRAADEYLYTLSRRLMTVSDRIEEIALNHLHAWLSGSHQRIRDTSPAFITALKNTAFNTHPIGVLSDDLQLPHAFTQVWNGLQSCYVSEACRDQFFGLAPLQVHAEYLHPVSDRRASEGVKTFLLPPTLAVPNDSSWFWHTKLARLLFPDRYFCATFTERYQFLISHLYVALPPLSLSHAGLMPDQEPMWKRIIAQAIGIKTAIALVDKKINQRSRLQSRSRRLLHELKRLLQQQAYKLEVHKVKFTRLTQRGDDRPRLNPAMRPKEVKEVTHALEDLNQSIRNHAHHCASLYHSRSQMIRVGEKFYMPSYGPVAREIGSLPTRICEFSIDQLQDDIEFAQLWLDQIRDGLRDSKEQLAQYQHLLVDEKEYHVLLAEAWDKLNPALFTFGQVDRYNRTQQLKHQFEQPVPWYTPTHVMELLDQVADADEVWADAAMHLSNLVRITEHPDAGLPYLDLINRHPLLKDLINCWDLHLEERSEQLDEVQRRLSHMQVDLTLDFVPYVMSLPKMQFEKLMKTLDVEPQDNDTPEQYAQRAMMVCRLWSTVPDKYVDKQVIIKGVEQQLIAYHAQLQKAVEKLKEFCAPPKILIKHLHHTIFSHLPDAVRPTEMDQIQIAFDEIKAQWQSQQKTLMHIKKLQRLQTQALQKPEKKSSDRKEKSEAQDASDQVDDHLSDDLFESSECIDLNGLFKKLSGQWCQKQLRQICLQFFTEDDTQQLFEGNLDLNQQPHVVRMRWCRAFNITLNHIQTAEQKDQQQLDQIKETLDEFHQAEKIKSNALSILTRGLALLACDDDSQFFLPALKEWKEGRLSVTEQRHVLSRYQQKCHSVMHEHRQAVTTLKAAAKSMQRLFPQIDIYQLDEARQRQLDRMVNKSIELSELPQIEASFSNNDAQIIRGACSFSDDTSPNPTDTFGRFF